MPIQDWALAVSLKVQRNLCVFGGGGAVYALLKQRVNIFKKIKMLITLLYGPLRVP